MLNLPWIDPTAPTLRWVDRPFTATSAGGRRFELVEETVFRAYYDEGPEPTWHPIARRVKWAGGDACWLAEGRYLLLPPDACGPDGGGLAFVVRSDEPGAP